MCIVEHRVGVTGGRMAHFTRTAIAELKRQLSEWQSPVTMLDVIRPIESETLFNQAGLDFLRDALTGAEFCRIRRVRELRLPPAAERWPDFEIRHGGVVEQFEAVEVDDPERERGLEYRSSYKQPDEPTYDYLSYVDKITGWIEMACRKKVEKQYSKGASLIIHLNASDYGSRPRMPYSFPEATKLAKDHFKSVRVLWKTKVYRAWRNGKNDWYVIADTPAG